MIKFTMNYSATEVNILGVTVTKVGNKLETVLYCEANDTHQYLHAQSCHHNVYKRSIAYRQVARFKKIYSIEEKCKNHFKQLKLCLVKWRYKEAHVDSEIEREKLVNRTVLFQKRDKKVGDSITLVLRYHPTLNRLSEFLQRAHKYVLKLPKLQSALPSPPRESF